MPRDRQEAPPERLVLDDLSATAEAPLQTRLIYCAGGNSRYGRIACANGFLYGARSDSKDTSRLPISFVDINWKRADWAVHLDFVAKHRPLLTVVPDITDWPLLDVALSWADALRPYTEKVIFVPKITGCVRELPDEDWVVIGYSVPSKYAGADPAILDECGARPLHLLGGNPQNQLRLAQGRHIFSADGNAAMQAARWGVTFDGVRRQWLRRDPAITNEKDMPYRAFEKSCRQIRLAWQRYEADAAHLSQPQT